MDDGYSVGEPQEAETTGSRRRLRKTTLFCLRMPVSALYFMEFQFLILFSLILPDIVLFLFLFFEPNSTLVTDCGSFVSGLCDLRLALSVLFFHSLFSQQFALGSDICMVSEPTPANLMAMQTISPILLCAKNIGNTGALKKKEKE